MKERAADDRVLESRRLMAEGSRAALRRFFEAAIARVDGRSAVREALQREVDGAAVRLIAVGKAAAAMTQGALDVLDTHVVDGLVITKHGHGGGLRDRRLRLLEADHPVPAIASLAAGEALLEYYRRLPSGTKVLVLISGGASSLVEVLPEGFSLADLRALTKILLASGWDIHRINRVRRQVSRIKGGKLFALNPLDALEVLLISDVPGDDPAMIGSGLFWPAADESVEWPAAAREYRQRLPDTEHDLEVEVPPHRIVACLEDAKRAAAESARQAGWPVFVHDRFLQGPVEAVARDLVDWLQKAPPGLHVWGGETTVALPPSPGRGGRNQHLALHLARLLDGGERISVLAAGTDGTDGPTADAGGIVDGGTIARGVAAGLDVDVALASCDAGTFLAASGDLLTTGPTGTNVMDMVIAAVADSGDAGAAAEWPAPSG